MGATELAIQQEEMCLNLDAMLADDERRRARRRDCKTNQSAPWNWPSVATQGSLADPSQFLNVIDIPEGKSGNFAVTKFTAPAKFLLNVSRYPAESDATPWGEYVSYDHETTWHSLNSISPVYCWMSDTPAGQAAMRADTALFAGKVLVGGLGLGFIATVLAKKKSVTKVVVVEREMDVIKLVGQHLLRDDPEALGKLSIVHGDVFAHLQGCRYNHAFFDIWAGPSRESFFDLVVPLLAKCSDVVVNRPVCWAEPVMRRELYHDLLAKVKWLSNADQAMVQWLRWVLAMPVKGPGENTWNWCVPFFRRGGPMQPADVARYVGIYGEPDCRAEWALPNLA